MSLLGNIMKHIIWLLDFQIEEGLLNLSFFNNIGENTFQLYLTQKNKQQHTLASLIQRIQIKQSSCLNFLVFGAATSNRLGFHS